MKKPRRKAARSRKPAQRIKVFISHATADRKRAERLGNLLTDHGIDYWFSREHLVRGEDWYRGIGKALGRCNWLVIAGSRAAVRSRWVRDEVTYALLDKRYGNHVIPLLFEECQLKRLAWTLQAIQHIDFRKGWQSGSDELLRRLGVRTRRTVS